MSDFHERFERLARRGTARGVDAVLDGARRRAEDHGTLAGVDDDASTDASGLAPVINIEPVNLETVRARRTRRRFGSVVAAGGVAASLFVGALAIGSFVGNGGGSSSPEAAVRQLADAVSHEDALSAADVLAPEEVRSLRGTVDLASKRAQELALARSASAPLAGLDLSVDKLSLSTTSLGAGFAKVTVNGGTISARTHDARFSPLMQQVLRNSRDNSAQADLSTLARGKSLPTFVMTVKRGGNWYVSAAYTALEYIREINGLPAADFGSGVRATATLGAASPDAAVSNALRALAHNDWPQLISLAPPDEIPVYDYRAALEQLAADSGTKTDFTVAKLDTTSTVNGDTAKVVLTASGLSGSGGTWSATGSCFRFPGLYATTNSVSSSAGVVQTGRSTILGPGGSQCGLSLFSGLDDNPADATSAPITVVREGGRWFVSPVGTVLDLVDRAITNLSRRTLYSLLNVPQLLPPDGVLTLGRPVTVSNAGLGAAVYTFDGHAGERLLGLASTKPTSPEYGFLTQVRVFGPDGKELQSDYGVLQGQSLQLPADGTYTFVIQSFSGVSRSSVTIWDEAQAPEAAKHPPSLYSGQVCKRDANGGETCTSSGTGLTSGFSPPTAPSAPLTSVPGSRSSSATSVPAP
jgi:hypothetical protein